MPKPPKGNAVVAPILYALACACVLSASVPARAQTGSSAESSAVPAQAKEDPAKVRPMQVGDRWVYRFHNKGDKLEPVEQWQQVLRINGNDAFMYFSDGRANADRKEWLSRWDQKRAKQVELFAIDLSRNNGIGERFGNSQPADDFIQLPLAEGKKYKFTRNWPDGRGHDEYSVTVGPLKKHRLLAGEFWAYEIEGKGWWYNTTSPERSSGRLELIELWSPELGRFIKQTYKNWTSNARPWSNSESELTLWQPAAAPVKDIEALAEAQRGGTGGAATGK